MKNTFKALLLSSALGITLLSCNEPEVKQSPATTETSKTEVIDFMGEKVVIGDNFPKELLNQSLEDFEKLYSAANAAENLRRSSDESITYEELNSIISPLTKKYPDVSINKEVSKADQARIYNDFPNISSVEQIREKSHIILAYYEALLKEEAVPAVVAYKKNKVKSGLRTSGIGDPLGVLYPYEETVIMNNPRLVPGYTSATILAKLMGDRYGSANVGQRGDALRHGAWNCLIIRNSIILGASRDNATEYAQKGTTAHEITCANCYIYDHDVAMDLFNNISARSWMRSEIGWGVGPVRDMPTESRIELQMRNWADNAGLINVPDYLNHIVLGLNNEPNNWGQLYGANTWWFQHFMYYNN